MKKRLIGIFFALVLIGACVPLARAFADEAGPLDHVVITPVTANITAGGTQQFTAVAEDSNNVTISGLSFIWSVVNGGGTIDDNGLFTAGNVTGTFPDTVLVTTTQNGTARSAFATVTVNGLVLDHVTLTPIDPTVNIGSTQQFTAVAKDSDNTTITGLTFAWSVVNGGGTIDNAGLFTAGNVTGTFPETVLVTTTQGDITRSALASVEVTGRILDHVVIAPTDATVNIGGTQQFTAIAEDSNNVTIPGLSFTWSVVNGGGSINGSGLFTAGNVTGTFPNTVKVTVSQGSINVAAYATVTVTPQTEKKGKTPPGFAKGNKNGWEDDTPPGWSQGAKKGWGDDDMPPGLAKKTPGLSQGGKQAQGSANVPPGLAKGKKDK